MTRPGGPRRCFSGRRTSRRAVSPVGRVIATLVTITALVCHQGMHDQPGPTSTTSPADHRPELLALRESGRRGEHGVAKSGRQLGTALAPTGGQNRPASAGPHPQAEPMGLRAATVVGLEGALALAHGRSPGFSLHNRSTRVLARLHGRLNGAGEVHAKGTRRKRETLRGYAPGPTSSNRGYQVRSFSAASHRWRYWPGPESCGWRPRLLACPFCCGEGEPGYGDRNRGARALNPRGVRW
jgi:hypothetical protein